MKIPILSTIFALCFASNLISAASIPVTFGQSALEARAYSEDTNATRTPMSFPPTAISPFGPTRFKRDPALGLTNGELLRRGLQPARPRKIVKQKKDLEIRQATNPPAQAFPSPATTSPSRTYNFAGCRNGVGSDSDTRRYTLTFTDLQDLANQCAARQDADRLNNPTNPNRSFALYTFSGPGTINCATSIIVNTATVTCSASTVGVYSPTT